MEALFALLGTVFSTLFPFMATKKTDSEEFKKYKELRFEVSEALAKYGYCYCTSCEWNNLRTFKTMESFHTAAACFCSLSARFHALAETLPDKYKDIPITKMQLELVAENLKQLEYCIMIPITPEEEQQNKSMAKAAEIYIRECLSLKI